MDPIPDQYGETLEPGSPIRVKDAVGDVAMLLGLGFTLKNGAIADHRDDEPFQEMIAPEGWTTRRIETSFSADHEFAVYDTANRLRVLSDVQGVDRVLGDRIQYTNKIFPRFDIVGRWQTRPLDTMHYSDNYMRNKGFPKDPVYPYPAYIGVIDRGTPGKPTVLCEIKTGFVDHGVMPQDKDRYRRLDAKIQALERHQNVLPRSMSLSAKMRELTDRPHKRYITRIDESERHLRMLVDMNFPKFNDPGAYWDDPAVTPEQVAAMQNGLAQLCIRLTKTHGFDRVPKAPAP